MKSIPDAPEIRRALETGETGDPRCCGPLVVCDDCGDTIRDWSWTFEGLTLCRDCLRERLTDYLTTNFREAAEALGCTATYLG